MIIKQGMEIFKNKKQQVFMLLFFVVIVGTLLRTYNFSDWLRFNADQARDASVVREMIEKKNIPLLGPVAGGTDFRIGPMSIYFQFVGAWIFGVSPDKMAYADLFFGILSVPLIFLLFREYFSDKISLVSAALYGSSFFAVQYSRFAWNSNSAQFFVVLLLYGIIKMSCEENKIKKLIWLIVSAVSLGVVVQLHTLLLFSVPLFFIIIGVHLVKNKKITILHVVGMIVIALAVNFPQIVNEIRTDQANVTAFYDGLFKKSTKQATLGENILHVVSCQTQANVRILLPRVDQESCSFPFSKDNLKKLSKKNETATAWFAYAVGFVFALSFSAAGYYLVTRNAFRIKDDKKRIFFAVIFSYCIALFLVSFPFGSEISLRYFILTAFVPYLFVALLLELSFKKATTVSKFFLWGVVGVIFVYNLIFCMQVFKVYADKSGNMIDGSMNQAKIMAEYLIKQSSSYDSFQIGGKNTDIGRFVDRISYFTNKENISALEIDDQKSRNTEIPFFVVVSDMSKKCEPGEMYKDYGVIEKCKKIENVTILEIL